MDSPQQNKSPESCHDPSILLVDDSDFIRESLSEILQDAGYSTIQARDGLEGLKQLDRYNPPVVLLDVRMPTMDGLSMLTRIREKKLSVEAIMLTAHESVEDAQRAIELGAFGYLTKPIAWEDLLDIVSRAFAQFHGRINRQRYREHLEQQVADQQETIADALQLLDRKEHLMNCMLNGITEGILAVDRRGLILFMNPSAEKLLGMPYSEAAGTPLLRLRGKTDGSMYLVDSILEREKMPRLIRVGGYEKGVRHFVVTTSPLQDENGSEIGTVANILDRTDRVESERLRDFFLTNVSHELRTPVTVLGNYLSLLTENADLPGSVREIATDMQDTTRRLRALVQSIIRIADVSTTGESLRAEPVDIPSLLERTLKSQSAEIEYRALEISTHDELSSPRFHTEPHLLAIAFEALIDTAVKRSRKEGIIRITLQRSTEGRSLRIQVSDNGECIPDLRTDATCALLDHDLCDRTVQPSDEQSLGVFLAHRVARLLGGSLEIASVRGEETTTTMEINEKQPSRPG